MNRLQPIYDIAEICSKKGLSNAVLCPGSRCAPLALAFVRHEKINSKTFSDERSAGFVALGMAQQSNAPTLLLCTSGTAAYNFSPAVAEAYFSQTPLILFTADRPAEWIGQHDGQAIYQFEIFGKHVKKTFQLPQDYDHADSVWAINRMVNEAINLSMQEPRGPVHINVPLREPLYPAKGEMLGVTNSLRVVDETYADFEFTDKQKKEILDAWSRHHHILIVAGQQDYNQRLIELLQNFSAKHNIPIIADIIGNLHPIENLIRHSDVFMGQATADVKKSLQPDLLITFGKSVLSKSLKGFLRNYKPHSHWHIQPAGMVADTFQTLTKVIRATPYKFFTTLNAASTVHTFENQMQNNYTNLWEIEERKSQRGINDFFPQHDFGEFELVKKIIHQLPANSNLHLANSMSVRYANLIGLDAAQHGIRVFSNRGTSGIDGCTSTVIGHCLTNNAPHILITGDLAFFYDRNAFWHNYHLPNLRVVLLNNHGGIIFKIIDGPDSLPEADEYFVTSQTLNAEKLCVEFSIDYLKIDHKRKFQNLLIDFLDFDGKTKIMEFESEAALNKSIFDNFRVKIKSLYGV